MLPACRHCGMDGGLPRKKNSLDFYQKSNLHIVPCFINGTDLDSALYRSISGIRYKFWTIDRSFYSFNNPLNNRIDFDYAEKSIGAEKSDC